MDEKIIIKGQRAEVVLIELKKNITLQCCCPESSRNNCRTKRELMIIPDENRLTFCLAKLAIRNISNNPLTVHSGEGLSLYSLTGTDSQTYLNGTLCNYLHKEHFASESLKRPGVLLSADDTIYCYLAFKELPATIDISQLVLTVDRETFDFRMKDKIIENYKRRTQEIDSVTTLWSDNVLIPLFHQIL